LNLSSIHPSFHHIDAPKCELSLSNIHAKVYGYAKKKRGTMACQRSMTHSEVERKDGMPKKHDPQ